MTDLQIKALKPPTNRTEIPFGDRLFLVHSPTGTKSWAYRYRLFDKPKKLTLGRYLSPADMLPDTISAGPKLGGPLSISGAKMFAQKAGLALEQGVDPALVLQGTGSKSKPRELGAVFEDFIRSHVAPHNRASTAKETARLFEKKIRPKWSGRSLESIRRADVIDLLKDVSEAGAPITANRVLALLRKFFNWCIEQELIEASPCMRVKPLTPEESRDRFLTDDEIGILWRASGSLSAPYRQWVRILLLTGQRRSEIAGLKWAEISKADRVFAFPKGKTKNNQAHVVHISSAVETELNMLPRLSGHPDYVFTSGRVDVNGALTAFSGFSKVKSALDTLLTDTIANDCAQAGLDPKEAKPFAPWRWHDLRRTMATGMQKLGVEQRVVEKAINHVSGSSSGIVSVYQRHEFMPERRAALELWAERVLELGKEQTEATTTCDAIEGERAESAG